MTRPSNARDAPVDPRPDPRELLLDAGIDLLRRAASDLMLRALTVRAVSGAANRSTGAFYHYWETQAAYVHDLVDHLMRPTQVVDADPISDELARLDGSQIDAETIGALFDAHTEELADHPDMRLMMLLWSMPDEDHHVRSGLREVYQRYQTEFGATYRRIIGATDAQLIDGLTFEDVAAMLAAMADGVALRRRFDPDGLPGPVVRTMVHALLGSLLVPRNAARSVDDVAAGLDAALHAPAAPG